MASKCRNIWDTLRGGDLSASSASFLLDTDIVKPSTRYTEELPASANRSKWDSKGERGLLTCCQDPLKTSLLHGIGQDVWPFNSEHRCPSFLKTECLQPSRKSSVHGDFKFLPSNNADASAPPVLSTGVSKNHICASKNMSCVGSNCFLQNARISDSQKDANTSSVSPVSVTGHEVIDSARSHLNVLQQGSVKLSDQVTAVKTTQPCNKDLRRNLEEREILEQQQQQFWAHSQSELICCFEDSYDASKQLFSQTGFKQCLSRNNASYISPVNCDFDKSVGWVTAVQHVTSPTPTQPIPDPISSFAQANNFITVPDLNELKLGEVHDLNSEGGKNFLDNAAVERTCMISVFVSESNYSAEDIKSHSSDNFKMEILSDSSEIPLFNCPFSDCDITDDLSAVDMFPLSGITKNVDTNVGQQKSVSSVTCSIVHDLSSVFCSGFTSDLVSPKPAAASASGSQNMIDPADSQQTACSQALNPEMTENNAYVKLQQYYQSERVFRDGGLESEKCHDGCESLIKPSPTSGESKESQNELGFVKFSEKTLLMPKNNIAVLGERTKLLNCNEDAENANNDFQNTVEGNSTLLGTGIFLGTKANMVPEINHEKLQEPSVIEENEPRHLVNINNDLRHCLMNSNKDAVFGNSQSSDVLPYSFSGQNVAVSNKAVSGDHEKLFTLSRNVRTHSEAPSSEEMILEKLDMENHVGDVMEQRVVLHDERTNTDHQLDLSSRTGLTDTLTQSLAANMTRRFSVTGRPFSSSSEVISSSDADDSRISENAVSLCTLSSDTSQPFQGTWNCQTENVRGLNSADSFYNLGQMSDSRSLTSGLKQSMLDLESLRMSITVTSPNSEVKCESVLSGDGCTENCSLSWGFDSADEVSWEKKSWDSISDKSQCEIGKKSMVIKTDKCNNSIQNKKLKRHSRLLNEIANSDGYVAEKKQNSMNDSLYIDSRFLSREERVLQMVHMQITKMEVKEELVKLKKSKDVVETSHQKKRIKLKADGAVAPTQKIHRFIKTTQGRINKSSKLFCRNQRVGKSRVKHKDIWSPKLRKHAELKDSLTCKKEATHCWQNQNSTATNKWEKAIKRKEEIQKAFQDLEPDVGGMCSKQPTAVKRDTQKQECLAVPEDEQSFMKVAVISNTSLVPCSNGVLEEPKGLLDKHDTLHRLSPVVPVIPVEVKRIIVCHNTGETVLHKAARLGYADVALWCCQSGYINVNATDNAGYTPLHETCIGSQVLIAKYLIHHGANINAASGVDGRRPIHEAIESDCLEMVRLLISAGADISLTTYSGRSVLELVKSSEMNKFIRAYTADLTDANCGETEVEWEFAPIWSGDSDVLGADLISDVPVHDPKTEEFYVECASRPL